MSGFGWARVIAEFLAPLVCTYQEFFATKRTLFLETGLRGLLFDREHGENKEAVRAAHVPGWKRYQGIELKGTTAITTFFLVVSFL